MTYYDVLQISPAASPEVIRAAYRVLAQRAHPDRAGVGAQPDAMKAINTAYEVLSDAARRTAYDARLAARVSVPASSHLMPSSTHGKPTGPQFSVTWQLGSVIGVESWSESHVQSKGGDGFVLMGYGFTSAPRVSTRIVPRQRIALRLATGDQFIEETGTHLDVIGGQRIVLLSVTAPKLRRPTPFALWNLNTGYWFWLSAGSAVGGQLRPPLHALRDSFLFAVGVILSVWGGWHLVRGFGLVAIALYLVLGAPFLVGAWVPLLFRAGGKIDVEIRRRVAELIEQLKTREDIYGNR
ncbi:MAG: J domain-containing protein [Betaproteobacteria bacterium]|nr:J domain-containing protein [Betaproteobacteria bacterium]